MPAAQTPGRPVSQLSPAPAALSSTVPSQSLSSLSQTSARTSRSHIPGFRRSTRSCRRRRRRSPVSQLSPVRRDVFIHCAVAVVVQAVADLSWGSTLARHVRLPPEHSVVPAAQTPGRPVSQLSPYRDVFIHRAVAVVVEIVADLGGGCTLQTCPGCRRSTRSCRRRTRRGGRCRSSRPCRGRPRPRVPSQSLSRPSQISAEGLHASDVRRLRAGARRVVPAAQTPGRPVCTPRRAGNLRRCAVAVVVEAVADLGRGSGRRSGGQLPRRSTRRAAAQTPAGRSSQLSPPGAFVHRAVAVVVQVVADLSYWLDAR